jgi:uncharacterized membrane protein YqjE
VTVMAERFIGLFASARRFCDTILAIVHNRVELFAVELQEEKVRLLTLFIWAVAVMLLGMLALAVVTFTIVFLVPEGARGWVLLGFSIFYVLAFVGAVFGLRQQVKYRPPPFSGTISEIKKDRAWLNFRR